MSFTSAAVLWGENVKDYDVEAAYYDWDIPVRQADVFKFNSLQLQEKNK